MTKQSLEFLYELLCNTQISVGHPDFDGRIELIVTAKRELEEELMTNGGRTSFEADRIAEQRIRDQPHFNAR